MDYQVGDEVYFVADKREGKVPGVVTEIEYVRRVKPLYVFTYSYGLRLSVTADMLEPRNPLTFMARI